MQFSDKNGIFLEKNEFVHDFPLHDVDDLIWVISGSHQQTKTIKCVVRVFILGREEKILIRIWDYLRHWFQ